MIRPPDPIMRQCRHCGRTGPDAFGRCRCGAEYGRLTIGLDRPADPPRPAERTAVDIMLEAAQLALTD